MIKIQLLVFNAHHTRIKEEVSSVLEGQAPPPQGAHGDDSGMVEKG